MTANCPFCKGDGYLEDYDPETGALVQAICQNCQGAGEIEIDER